MGDVEESEDLEDERFSATGQLLTVMPVGKDRHIY